MNVRIKRALFYLKASLIAPIHFKPKNCPFLGVGKCPIWNC